MSDLAAIWDAVARKAGLIEGVELVHSKAALEEGSKVVEYAEDLPITPAVVVTYQGTEPTLIAGNGLERVDHRFDLTFYVHRGDLATSMGQLALFEPRTRAAFRTGIRLGGIADQALYDGTEAITPDEINQQPFLAMDVHIRVKDQTAQQYTG